MKKAATLLFNLVNSAVFLIVLVALPVALISIVGWPGPTTTPELAKIESVVTGREQVPPLFLTKSLAVVAWLVWSQLVLAMVEEVRAIRLDLVAKKSFVLPGIQKFVASAVLAITLLLNGMKSANAAPVASPTPVVQPLDANRPVAPIAETPEVVGTLSYVTQPGDSWWTIAETFLGNGERFSEIRQLNVGASFNGLVVQENSDYLGSGWRIELPADAKVPLEITVQPGDTLSELEEAHGLGSGDLAKVNGIEMPDLIHPGQKLDVPNPVGGSVVDPEKSSPPPQAPAPPPQAPPPQPPVSQTPAPPESGGSLGSDQQALPVLQTESPETAADDAYTGARLVVGGLLATLAFLAPALWLIRRRRFRAQLRTVTTEQPEVLELDQATAAKMAAAASYGDDEFLAVLLRLVGQRMSSTMQDPGLVAVMVNDDHADLVFDDPPSFEPGPGFSSAGNKWKAERPANLTQMKSQASISVVPYAATVSLGSIGETSIAVNLEQLGGLNVIGSQSEVREVMFNIAVELASSSLAEAIRIVVVGLDMNLPGLDRIEQCDSVPPELRNAQKVENPGLVRLLSLDLASAQPVVVISPDASVSLDSLGPGVVPVLANSEREGLADLLVHGSLVSLPRLGFSNVERVRISPREICEYIEPTNATSVEASSQGVGSESKGSRSPAFINLVPPIEAAATPTSSNPVPLSPIALAAMTTGPVAAQSRKASPNKGGPGLIDGAGDDGFRPVVPLDLGFSFVVSVLGPLKLDGVGLSDPEKKWRYTKTAELIVLLATSDVPRTGDTLKELLWPARDPVKCGPALANATSDARIRVVGEERFPKLAPGSTLYKVDGIGTDLDLFEEHLDRAKASTSEAASMQYREAALDLVEGQPFDTFARKSSGYGWADSLMMSATVQIVNVAVELSWWSLDTKQYCRAIGAAEKGLRAAPENYELLNLFGRASLAASDDESCRIALAKIMDIENDFVEGTPGLSEPELPEDLRETQLALEKRLSLIHI